MSEDKLKVLEVPVNNYVTANNKLVSIKDSLHDDIEKIRTKYKEPLKSAIDAVVSSHENLKVTIIDNPEFFVKPKTRTMSGIKFGFRKGTDEVVYNIDEDSVIELIKSELPRKKKLLIKTTEKLIKLAVKNLPGEELKLIECLVEENDDVVIIKTADDEIDKFIISLTKDLD